MRCGLFGKLPLRRDFVSIAAPREVLGPWERWLQAGLSASRARLGAGWQAAFLHAPIWRFWLGADLCGASVLGAFMPSVDEVGRYFPLSIFAWSGGGAAIPPPELHAQEEWFAAVEGLLLLALEPDTSFDAVVTALEGLPPPAMRGREAPPAGAVRLAGGALVVSAEPAGFRGRLAEIREREHERAYAADTVWWTAGGEGFPPLAVVERGLPDPYLFASMLTGRFEADGG